MYVQIQIRQNILFLQYYLYEFDYFFTYSLNNCFSQTENVNIIRLLVRGLDVLRLVD